MMNDYELTIVFSTSAAGEAGKLVESLEKVVKDSKGEVAKKEEWGKKTFSYPVQNFTDGLYYYMELSLPPSELGKIDRRVRLDENVIRYLLVKKQSVKG